MSNNNVPTHHQPENAVVHPPAPPSQDDHDLQEEDFQNMEEIERELAKAMGVNPDEDEDDFDDEEGFPANSKSISQSVDYLPSGAMPTVNGKLSSHAAEFWFPESRDCKCCKGFKYGCPCAKSGFLACQESGCVEAVNVGKRANITIAVPPPNNNNSHNPPGSAGGKSLPSPSGPGGAAYCKFEFSPGGCRFGSTCRFVHQGLNRTNSAESPRGIDGRAFCPYFMRGNCDFGDKCRYAHI
mmetsp:Transcript_7182/g.7855  ORF Transcript_7182/g.7855 Transcript_7182/m.7855 type:complete len:240 (+) Transcript_7182:53-772(+)